MDYFQEENDLVKKLFNLDEILNFKHDIQIIRGSDYQYVCYIDKTAYSVALTPMCALVFGLKKFKEVNEKTTKLLNE